RTREPRARPRPHRPPRGPLMSTFAPPRPLDAARLARACRAAAPEQVGRVSAVVGLSLDVVGVRGAVGDVVVVGDPADGAAGTLRAEVVAVTEGALRCLPLGPAQGLRTGLEVRATGRPVTVPTGRALLG